VVAWGLGSMQNGDTGIPVPGAEHKQERGGQKYVYIPPLHDGEKRWVSEHALARHGDRRAIKELAEGGTGSVQGDSIPRNFTAANRGQV